MNEELEYSIAATVCLEPKTVLTLRQIVTVDDFNIPACARVFDAANSAVARGKAFDVNLAADELRGLVDDPRRFLADCIELTPTTANAEEWAELLHCHAAEKRLREGVLLALEGDNPAVEIAEICKAHLQREAGGRLKTAADALTETLDALTAKEQRRIDTGFPILDGIVKGFEPGQLILVGARPGVGKSAFLLDLAETAARGGNDTLFVSLEMLAGELTERMIARRSGLTLDELIDRNLPETKWDVIANVTSRISNLPLRFYDNPHCTVSDIRKAAASIPQLRLIVVDYLGLMAAERKADSRNLELGQISRDLKNLSCELRIPVVAAAQLNRSVNETERPTLLSLRDSGELEQNASKAILLWKIDEDGTVGVSVAKNRRGRTGVVQFRFDGAHQRFTELSTPYIERPPQRKKGFLSD